jgi:DNA-binding response OmpR family regulator
MRILIVEDDTNMQGALSSTLKAACFVVDTASDGEEGSYMARTNEYDLAIFDYMLPKKDGCQLCTEVRSAGKGFPILMLSVKDHAHSCAQERHKSPSNIARSFPSVICRQGIPCLVSS